MQPVAPVAGQAAASVSAGSVSQLGGNVGLQAAGLVSSQPQAPQQQLLAALLLTLLLDKHDDCSKKSSASDFLASLAFLSAFAAQGSSLNAEFSAAAAYGLQQVAAAPTGGAVNAVA